MPTRPGHDYTQLPPTVPADETVAFQLEREQPYGGPGGDGDAVGAVDGDGD